MSKIIIVALLELSAIVGIACFYVFKKIADPKFDFKPLHMQAILVAAVMLVPSVLIMFLNLTGSWFIYFVMAAGAFFFLKYRAGITKIGNEPKAKP